METPKVLEVIDRRRTHRYDLETQVTFYWKDPEGIRHREQALIHNISQTGAFVATNSYPPIGAAVRLEVLFSFATAQGVRVEAEGQVVRVETADQSQARCGFAVATNVMKVFDRKLYEMREENRSEL